MEEGEIEDNSAFDLFKKEAHNSSPNDEEISPVFQSLFSRRNDPLFGSSDVDLRFRQNPNAFNDCDERLIPGQPIHNYCGREQNPRFMPRPFRPISSSGHWRPPNSNPRPRFSRDLRVAPPVRFRPEVPLVPFARSDSRPPLLPTPQQARHSNFVNRFPRPRPPFRTPFNGSSNDRPLLRPPVDSLPLTANIWSQNSDPKIDSFVPSIANQMIPFICEPSVHHSETVNLKVPDIGESFRPLNEINSTQQSSENTIVLSANDDIEEVQMQDIEEVDEAYDPEQDISMLCPLSPPIIPTEEQSSVAKISSEKHIDVEESKIKFDQNNDNNERIERLERLLKGQSLLDEKKCHKKHKTKNKSHKRESIRMTPKIGAEFVDTLRPVKSSSTKRVIHSKTCKKSHVSRRKIKKAIKKQVITKKVSQQDLNDTSYDELLEEYQRIQKQLKELEKEENTQTSQLRDAEREEKENIEKLMKSDDIFIVNEELKEGIVDDDEDECELRRLALESKVKREQKQKEEKEAEEEERRLREHLLQSLLNRTKSKSVDENKDSTPEKQIEEQDLKEEPIKSVTEQFVEFKQVNSPKTELPQRPVPQLVIHFGDDTTDEENDEISGHSEGPLGLESFIKQVRLKSETKASSGVSPSVLSITRQKELEKLKAEIVRRELNQITDKKLKQNESEWKSAKERLNEKISKQKLLKTRVMIKRNALRKAQLHARKLQEEFRAATKLVSSTAAEFHSFNNELKNIEKEMELEVKNVNKFETECYRMGLKLFGSSYDLPTPVSLKRSNSATTSVSPRKRVKSESKADPIVQQTITDPKKLLHKELVQKLENCSKLLSMKKAHLMRPSSPKISRTKPTLLSDLNFEEDLKSAMKCLVKELLTDVFSDSVISLNCFTERMFTNKKLKPLNTTTHFSENDINSSVNNTKTCLNDSYDSVLSHLHSYRLIEGQSIPLTSDHWTNNLNPMQEICTFGKYSIVMTVISESL